MSSTTMLPFLYQTRTIQRLSRTTLKTTALRAYYRSEPNPDSRSPPSRARRIPPTMLSRDPIPFDLPTQEFQKPRRKWQPEDLGDGQKTTLTPTERFAFDTIFQDIVKKNKPTEDDPLEISVKDPGPEAAHNTVKILLQDAAAAYTKEWRPVQRPFDPLSPVEQTQRAVDRDSALLRFPPSLRQAARVALGILEQDKGTGRASILNNPKTAEQVQEQLPADSLSKQVAEEAMRREKRTQVESKMRAATSDFQLWDILEEEVFSMVKKLGITDRSAVSKTPAKKSGCKTKEVQEDGDYEYGYEFEPGQERLSMHLYGPLYPAYLLYGLRLLDTSFSRSSPLALNVLPRIKELGLASYVLGASTPFYNLLAHIHWHRYGDAEAVFNLLEEMRFAGLYANEDSLAVVHSIETHFLRSDRGRMGPFMEELVSLPEYEFAIKPRIRHWSSTIGIHIQERQRHLQL
ncbi:hypothetical protein B0T09DRAFT_170402 [Sordaria sp. MPI-SDFR-AT-0083]|nr:hypothetical protein B0T09DRAFT_170402 [Sordaria sp. MPI-SDFR-AT-0083]